MADVLLELGGDSRLIKGAFGGTLALLLKPFCVGVLPSRMPFIEARLTMRGLGFSVVAPFLCGADNTGSSSAIQSARSIRDVFLPRFGGDGEGENCFVAVPATGVRVVTAPAADRGVSIRDTGLLDVLDGFGDDGGLVLSASCDDEPPASDSKAEIRD
jgi:hypothetical protein